MSVFELAKTLRNYLKIKELDIDNLTFKIHYRVTFVLLCLLSALVTSKQYFGDPIDCIVENIPQQVMDNYCWTHSTYSIQNISGVVGKDIPYPGVGPQHLDNGRLYHKYYQWVCLTLFVQAVLFYAPRFMWKAYERNRVKTYLELLKINCGEGEINQDKVDIVANHFMETRDTHNAYALKFYLCEIASLVNVIGQLFLMNAFLGGNFFTYGIDVIRYMNQDTEIRSDPMSKIFPIVTKCIFYHYGASGSLQSVDGLCILPLNILNEKIYVGIWFWFVFVTVLTILKVFRRLVFLLFGKLRLAKIKIKSNLSYAEAKKFVKYSKHGDMFVLSRLYHNVPIGYYREIVRNVNERLEKEEEENDIPNGHIP